MQITYKGLRYGMYVKHASGRVIWQISFVCVDRVIYKSTATNTIRTLKVLKHQNKAFIDVTPLFAQKSVINEYPF